MEQQDVVILGLDEGEGQETAGSLQVPHGCES